MCQSLPRCNAVTLLCKKCIRSSESASAFWTVYISDCCWKGSSAFPLNWHGVTWYQPSHSDTVPLNLPQHNAQAKHRCSMYNPLEFTSDKDWLNFKLLLYHVNNVSEKTCPYVKECMWYWEINRHIWNVILRIMFFIVCNHLKIIIVFSQPYVSLL